MRGQLNRALFSPVSHGTFPAGLLRAHLHCGEPDASKKCSPASEVAADAARRDNTGVGGRETLSTAAGFFLVIMVDEEPSFLLCVTVWSTFKWGLGIPRKQEPQSLQLLWRSRKRDNIKAESDLRKLSNDLTSFWYKNEILECLKKKNEHDWFGFCGWG